MMLVKSYIAQSKIEGIGIFAGQDIKKGTMIWKFNSIIDKKITKKEFEYLPEIAQKAVKHYAYMNKKGDRILCGDDARFFNHSDNPTCVDNDSLEEEDITVAKRDIKKGEEITSDYRSFDYSAEDKFVIN